MTIPEIETRRLLLRRFQPYDLEPLSQILLDPQVVRHLGDAKTATRAESERYLHSYMTKYWDEHGFGIWAVVYKENQELIGYCGLKLLEGKTELVYLFAQSYWGRGLATEAAKACVRFAFEDLKLDHLTAVAKPENLASRRVLERVGFKFDGAGQLYEWACVNYSMSRHQFVPDNSQHSVKFTQV